MGFFVFGVQVILKAHNGMDFHQMLEFLVTIGCHRCSSLVSILSSTVHDLPRSLAERQQSISMAASSKMASAPTASSQRSDSSFDIEGDCAVWLEVINQVYVASAIKDGHSAASPLAGLLFELICLLPVLDELLSSLAFVAVCSASERRNGMVLKQTAAKVCHAAVERLQLITNRTVDLSIDLSVYFGQ